MQRKEIFLNLEIKCVFGKIRDFILIDTALDVVFSDCQVSLKAVVF